MEIVKYRFTEHGDGRGQLIAVEGERDVPFPIRRVYYMYGVGEGIRRGYHAHKQLEQILICMHGSCKIFLDNGRERESVLLDSPGVGLYIGRNMWREMYEFSPDAVLVVLASMPYAESDYIRDYDQFISYVSRQEESQV
ncbi:MAG: WxcM-like domain-containing protein [Oscillibacter sp.]|jgi:dTDP-4-dehydrorhamnose 3,5-epimerase-like enzyme|nr:FdtA/QdtA family cupin domain-containing protein [uncultured Oscillibacter sp.]MCI8812197.1 WxcM-like domain-containing protein [Oscillibacter sp.]